MPLFLHFKSNNSDAPIGDYLLSQLLRRRVIFVSRDFKTSENSTSVLPGQERFVIFASAFFGGVVRVLMKLRRQLLSILPIYHSAQINSTDFKIFLKPEIGHCVVNNGRQPLPTNTLRNLRKSARKRIPEHPAPLICKNYG